MFRYLFFTLTFVSFAAGALHAADQDPAVAKMRDTLRNNMLQLRTIQGERDALQAEKATLEQEKKDLTAKLATTTKQLATDKDEADKAIAELKEKSAQQAAELTEVRASLEKWKASHKEVTEVAKSKEEARAALAGQNIELKRKVADQQRRNLAMFQAGKEILSRYEKFGLGTAITAREPFIGTMRVKLENLVQDYSDKLDEQRIKPEAPVRASH